LGLTDEERQNRIEKLNKIESQYIRAKRVKITVDCFKTIKIIGRGSFGEVFLVQMKNNGKLYAMKKLKKSAMIERNQVNHVQKERDALAIFNDFSQNNPWVTRLYYSFQDALYLYLIMEYVPGGDMLTQLMKLEVFTEDETRFYIAELVLAVDTVHRASFIHRDIKPDNILIDANGHIKLTDFGLSTGISAEEYADPFLRSHKLLRNNTKIEKKKSNNATSWNIKKRILAHSEVGTPDYMSPDVLNSGEGYGQEADWWSVGVIMFEMLAGFPIFYDTETESTFEKILNWRQYLDEAISEVELSPEAEDLIRRFCCDKKDRIGKNGVDEIKNHAFFKGIDWDNIRKQNGPFVPTLEHAFDTHNFPQLDIDICEYGQTRKELKQIEQEDKNFPIWRGRRFRQSDLPFIGFTYKNFAAAPSLSLRNTPVSALAAYLSTTHI